MDWNQCLLNKFWCLPWSDLICMNCEPCSIYIKLWFTLLMISLYWFFQTAIFSIGRAFEISNWHNFSQLCSGLQHMHNFDPPYAHNDVKPGNVLITHRKGQLPLAILMDFGSARPARRTISTHSEALQLQVSIGSSFLLAHAFYTNWNAYSTVLHYPTICYLFWLSFVFPPEVSGSLFIYFYFNLL